MKRPTGWGAALLELGLQPLDRVIFQIGNCNELLFGFIACLKAGLIPICTLAAHREQEIGYLGNHARARLHFVQGDDAKFDDVAFAERMRENDPVCGLDPAGARCAAWLGALSCPSWLRRLAPRTPACGWPLCRAIRFRSRCSSSPVVPPGVPKIIPRFHNEYLYQCRTVASFNGYRSDDVLFMPLPFMHNLNMGCFFGPFLLTGGTVTVAPNLTPDTFIDIFRRYDPTWAMLAGPIVAKLKPAIDSGALPLRRLRSVITANGGPTLRALLGVPVYHLFGMTEGVLMFAREGDPPEVLDTMHGRPISELDDVKIFKIGTEEEIVEDGIEGECAFRGPYTIHGYYDAPERNRETFTSGGLYRSGDLMLCRTIEGKRYFQYRGRTKDVVDRGGEKINCEEVELAVNRHPAVVSSAVVGMPDPVYGERVCAFVIAKDGASLPSVAELGAFLKQVGIAKFKWPERIEAVEDFPQTKSGKVSKPQIKSMIAAKLEAERNNH